MQLTSSQQKWIRISSVLGAVQGLTWTILSLICIIINDRDPNKLFPDSITKSYTSFLNFYMYWFHFYPGGNDEKKYLGLMSSNVFYAFAWVNFINGVAWFTSSLLIVIRQQHFLFPKYLKSWSHLTFWIGFIDFIFVVVIGANYGKCLSLFKTGEEQAICAMGILPVMVIAARGFTLWVINVIFGVIMFRIARQVK